MGWGRNQEPAAPAAAPSPAAPQVAPAGPAVTASQASLLSVQRSAGNGAVGALLQRAPSADAGPAVEAMIRREPDPDAAKSYAEHKEALYSESFMDLGKGEDGKSTPVNDEKAAKDLAELDNRLKGVPALKDTEFFPFIREYVKAAQAGDAGLALESMYTALAVLDSVGAFTVGGKQYRKLDHKPTPEELAPLRAKAMSNVHLWSKLNKYKAIETVKDGDEGLTLESSAAGSLFDGLDFGMHYGTNKVLGQQWKLVSKTFVAQSANVVHVQVLRGIDEWSVFFTTEWDEVKKLIEAGKVQKLVVHYFDLVDGELVEMRRPDDVYTQADFDVLPRVSKLNKAYAAIQQQTQDAEEERHRQKVAKEKARVEVIE